MNTIITEKTENGEASYDVFSKLIDSRIIFLHDYITDEIATDIVATLLYLDNQDSKEKISLYINSEGGSIESIFMIYDIIKMIESPVETFCIGSAFGEVALLLAAGTKGMRIATPSSIVCLNQLLSPASRYVDMVAAKILFEQENKLNSTFMAALSECTGKSLKTLYKDMDRELYLNPTDAKKYGLIDIVVEHEKIRK